MSLVGSLTRFFDTQLINFLHFFGSFWPKPNQSYIKHGLFYGKIVIAISYLSCGYCTGYFADNLYTRSNLASLSIHATLVVIRSFNFNVSWKGIKDILSELQNFVLEDEEEHLFIKKKMPKITIYSAVCLFTHHLWILGTVTVPLFMSERQLPLHIYFPLDWQNNVFFYVLGYIFGILGTTILVSMNALTSIFVCYIMLMVSLQLELFGKRIRKIGYTNAFQHKQMKNTEVLVNSIKMHKKFDKLIQKIEHYFSYSFLGEIAFGGISICAGAFSLSQGSLVEEKVRYINCFYELCISILHILLPLYFGNEMSLQMQNLSLAVYDSNWIEQSQEFRKITVIFLENLKKPRLISVAHVVPWNLETFTSILKLAYSMFNVLQSLEY